MSYKKFLKISFLIIAILLVFVSSFLFFMYRSGSLQKVVLQEIGKKIFNISGDISEDNDINKEIDPNFIQKFFGMEGEQTYLVLFLNNTELRPGGGFIGTYAVITMDRAIPHIIKVEGTENLSPEIFLSEPPYPIRKYLGLDRLYFRDSNWSPDFAFSSTKALDLYRQEKGILANDIDVVVAFTPTLIEGLLRITGPIYANGVEFTADNFTEKLEYEVEHGFVDKNIDFTNRKKMLIDLTKSVVTHSAKNIFKNWSSYQGLLEDMLEQKQLMAFSPHSYFQDVFVLKNWAGKMIETQGDYLLWVDANLGALKTDVVMDRELVYTISKTEDERYLAKATMILKNKGAFTWRTSRYRDYARVFVPYGSELIRTTGAMKEDKGATNEPAHRGIEAGYQWFGAFVSIEPGQTRELSFEYYISPEIAKSLKNNSYKLKVQKQLGSTNTKLKLELDFGSNLKYAYPEEKPENYGDTQYDFKTVLNKDFDFEINLK